MSAQSARRAALFARRRAIPSSPPVGFTLPLLRSSYRLSRVARTSANSSTYPAMASCTNSSAERPVSVTSLSSLACTSGGKCTSMGFGSFSQGTSGGAAEPQFHGVIAAVVYQGNGAARVRFAVNGQGRGAGGLHDVDVIHRLAIAVVHLEPSPIGRKAGVEVQLIHFQPESEQRFGDQAVHPPGGTRVPGPSAAADVR